MFNCDMDRVIQTEMVVASPTMRSRRSSSQSENKRVLCENVCTCRGCVDGWVRVRVRVCLRVFTHHKWAHAHSQSLSLTRSLGYTHTDSHTLPLCLRTRTRPRSL
eukprot:m.74164 g.74164  ORF g.74164 m.74164 type:complete len:105 (-) comp24629_c0_seq1:229-543(-)